MEYERIHKVQTGMISPTKLRMKLMGSHNLRKKDGSNSNSSRTSPSKLQDSDFANNSLLSSGDDEVTSSSVVAPSSSNDSSKENNNNNVVARLQELAKTDIVNQSTSLKILEDDNNLDYDSNASSSSFEFHRGERYSSAGAAAHGGSSSNNNFARAMSSSASRPMPSKWNDAEKWLVSRQSTAGPKRTALQNQTNRMSSVKVAPESGNCEKKVDFCKSALQIGFDKFSFAPTPIQPNRTNDNTHEPNGVSTIRSVCMRDMGTEMTPMTSLEPSMTSTPIGSVTPIRSPTSSMPSTPGRGGSPVPTSTKTAGPGDPTATNGEEKKSELSEEEVKLKTRREIVALGVRLGKTNIAAWASKDEAATAEKNKKKNMSSAEMAELERVEFEKRAAVWVEAEKSRHTARYKREEIKIQAWESQQRAKLEAELRRIEAQVEQMRAQAQAKMVKKIALTRQRSEEKRSSAEARKSRDAEITAAQAEYIRQTGRTPNSQYMCCGWL